MMKRAAAGPLAMVLVLALGAACSGGRGYVPPDGGPGGGGPKGSGGSGPGPTHSGGSGGPGTGTGGTGGSIGPATGTGGASSSSGGNGQSSGGAGGSGSDGTGGSGDLGSGGSPGSAGNPGSGASLGSGGNSGSSGAGGGAGTGTGGGGGLTCPTGKHACSGACADNASPSTCGQSCNACTAPTGATATCDGTSCGFTCGGATPKKCAAAGICVAMSGCCANSDCPTNAGGQTGTCDTATHMCNYSCSGSTTSCTSGGTTTCIPSTGCCTNADCPGNCMACNTTTHTCAAVKGMDDPNGRCTGTCDATGACKTKQGQSCTTGTQCVTGNCADGVCCNSACNGSCEFCNGTTPGTCGFVSGAPKTGHPACGGTGKCAGTCDGTKATCKMPGAETTCHDPSCSNGTQTSSATCNGTGTCPNATTTSCGKYACNTTTCFTNCSTMSQCAANNICSASQCLPCQSGENICANGCYKTDTDPTHCGTACKVCGGSTPSCAGGTCKCRQPSSSNILKNAGVDDSSLSSWMGNRAFNSMDSEGCTGSGSISIGPTYTDYFFQCLNSGFDKGTTYTFGFLYKARTSDTQYAYCSIAAFSKSGCAPADRLSSEVTQVASNGSTWVPGSVSMLIPSDAVSIEGHCAAVSGSGYYDHLFLSNTAASY